MKKLQVLNLAPKTSVWHTRNNVTPTNTEGVYNAEEMQCI